MKSITNYINESALSDYPVRTNDWKSICIMFKNATKKNKPNGGLCGMYTVDSGKNRKIQYMLAYGVWADELKKINKVTFQSSEPDIIYCACEEENMTSQMYELIGRYVTTAYKNTKNPKLSFANYPKYDITEEEFKNSVPTKD